MVISGFRILTLGSLLIENDGQSIDEKFITLKSALLFTYLAVNPGKHKRETLASFFWSETPDTQALKNLRTVLSDLRKIVPDFIQISHEAVEVKGEIWIDAPRFEAFFDALTAGEPMSLEKMLAVADLYKGEFLRGAFVRHAEGLEEWIDQKRNLLHHKYLQLLYLIVERCLEIGDFYRGVEIARQLVLLNPLWEAAQRQLMLLLVYLHQSGEALMQYERLLSLLQTELETEPEDETIALYEKIRGRMIQASPKKNSRSIVLPDLPYITPKKDIAVLREILDRADSCLISLTGVGGSGKTSLATFIAHERQGRYRDGIIIVPLAAIHNSKSLAQTILSYLNIPVRGDASDEQVISGLKDLEMLLVLDNYEQILPDTELVARILEEAAGVRLLVTSQMPLNLRQEWQLQLSGLEVHDSADSEAIQLFKSIAERVLPTFRLNPYLEEIQLICRLLEGYPMGIVIAASQVKYLAPTEILKILRSNILELKTNYQDLPARHQSFANLVESSLKNLSASERDALLALSMFRASFDHTAALAVANIKLPTFISLVDKSLIQPVENFRYTIHGVLRQLMRVQLENWKEKELVRERLTAYYVEWAHQLYCRKPRAEFDLQGIDIEHPNIWHIDLLEEAEKQDYLLKTIPALRQYWTNRGFGEEVIKILNPAIHNPEHPTSLRARGMVELAAILTTIAQQERASLLCQEAIETAPDNVYVQVLALQTLCRIAIQRGKFEEAQTLLQRVSGMESLRTSSDDAQIDLLFAGNHIGLGLIASDTGNHALARYHYEIAIRSFTQLNEPLRLADVSNNLGLLLMREGDYEAAKHYFDETLSMAQAAAYDPLITIALQNLGTVLMHSGDYAKAINCIKEALEVSVKIKRMQSILGQIETLTHIAYFIQAYPVAIQLHGFSEKFMEQHNLVFIQGTIDVVQRYVDDMRQILAEDFDLHYRLGEALSLELAVTLSDDLLAKLEKSDNSQSL